MVELQIELLFPPRAITGLRDLRGEVWQALVDKTVSQTADVTEQASFVLMMARLAGCATCHSGTHRALRGCQSCAQQAVRRYHGNDQELLELFNQACGEVQHYLLANKLPFLTKAGTARPAICVDGLEG